MTATEPNPMPIQTVTGLVHKQIESANQLLEILNEEYKYLSDRDSSALENAVTRKQGLILQLNNLTQEFNSVLNSAGFPADNNGIQEFIKHAHDPTNSQKLDNLWQTLLEVLNVCQQQNMINGSVTTVSYRNTQQILEILRGKESGSESCYSASGDTIQTTGNSQPLGKA